MPGKRNTLYDNLVSYWKLEEESGVRADATGAHPLSDNNSVLFSASGNLGNCASFDSGNSDYLERANGDAEELLGETGDWTFSTWVRPASRSTGAKVVSVWPGMGAFNRAWLIDLQADGGDRFFSFGVGSTVTRATDTVTANCADDTWAHVLVQHRDGTDIRIKVNNQAWIITTYTAGIGSVNTDFRLGGRGTTFDGLVDETGFWGRALTDDECAELYSGTYAITLY